MEVVDQRKDAFRRCLDDGGTFDAELVGARRHDAEQGSDGEQDDDEHGKHDQTP